MVAGLHPAVRTNSTQPWEELAFRRPLSPAPGGRYSQCMRWVLALSLGLLGSAVLAQEAGVASPPSPPRVGERCSPGAVGSHQPSGRRLACANGTWRELTSPRAAKDFASAGAGTALSPWTGWSAALAEGGEIIFDRGQVFAASGPLALPAGSFLHGGGTLLLTGPLALEDGFLNPGAGVVIEDLIIDGNRNQSQQTTQYSCIKISDAVGVQIRGNEIKSCSWAGVHLVKGGNVEVSGNRIHDIRRLKKDPIGNPDPPFFADGIAVTSGFEPYSIGSARGLRLIQGNQIWDVDDAGIRIKQGTVHFRVVGNEIWDVAGDADPNYKWSGAGIGIDIGHGSADGMVAENRLRNIGTVYGYNAIQIEAGRNLFVTGNSAVNGCESDLFSMAEITAGQGIVFSNNHFTSQNHGSYATIGIHLAGCSQCTVVGNEMVAQNRNLALGLWVDGRGPYGEEPTDIEFGPRTTYFGVFQSTFANNVAWGFHRGILVTGPNQHLTIEGNVLDVDGYGVAIDGGYDGRITGNQIRSASCDNQGDNAGAILVSNSVVPDAFLVQQDAGGTDLTLGEAARYMSQSFTPAYPILLTRVYVYLKRAGTPAGDFSFALYSDKEGRPEAVIAGAGPAQWTNRSFSSWAASRVPSSFAFYQVAELAPRGMLLQAGTTYHLVIHHAAGTKENHLAVNTCRSNPYPGGVVHVSTDGRSWTTLETSDLAFRIDKTVDPRRWLIGDNSVVTGGQCLEVFSQSSVGGVEDITFQQNSCTGAPGSAAVGIHDHFGSGGGAGRRAFLDTTMVNITTPLWSDPGATNRRLGTEKVPP